jgi:hypothetical protein
MARYSGQELESRLVHAGVHYGKLGPEAAKEFILALPPGGSGKSALVTACEQLVAHAPEMILWLSANRDRLSQVWSYAGAERLVVKWADSDWPAAMQFLLQTEGLDGRERSHWVTRALGWNDAPRDDKLLEFVESIKDEQLRRLVMASPAVLEVQLKQSIPHAVQSVLSMENPELRIQGLASVCSILPSLNDRGELLDSLLAADFEGKSTWIARYCWTWAQSDVNAAMNWANSVQDAAVRDAIIDTSWKVIAQYDPPAAEKWINSISDPAQRANALAGFRNTQNQSNK